jgi:acetyl-CoA synthetase
VCHFANVLKKHVIAKGDRVAIYLPMVLEFRIAMLTCARIGAIHFVVFGGFSAEALRNRMLDCDAKPVTCADGCPRGGKIVKAESAPLPLRTQSSSPKASPRRDRGKS